MAVQQPEDKWLQARARTQEYSKKFPENLIRWVTQSLPGRATKTIPFQILTAGRGLAVDLNKYRANVNVKMLYDLGVKIFDLRLFGPTYWVHNDWRYQQDASFESYYKILRPLPDVVLGGYGVYNPWLDEETNYTTPIDPNVEYMKLYFKNFPCDYYTWDVEVGEETKSTNLHNVITSINLVKGLSRTMRQTMDEMPKWPNGYPRIPEMYSANWFLKQYGGDPMKIWLENTLRDTTNLPFLTWLAWLPTVFSGTYQKPQDLFDAEITPTGVQEDAYLHLRSEPLASKWQLTFTLKGPWSPDVGCDASITYGLAADYQKYRTLHNIGTVVTPPQPPPGGDYATKAELTNYVLKSALTAAGYATRTEVATQVSTVQSHVSSVENQVNTLNGKVVGAGKLLGG